MPDFSQLERVIQNLFPIGHTFSYNGADYKVLVCGKPTCPAGEPKTDIYVEMEQLQDSKRYNAKISIKKDNAEFLENKTSAERAEAILGPDWKNIVTNSTLQLKQQFEARPLIYKTKYRKTGEGSITLGWKFEILDVKSGELSAEIKLSPEQKLDIYSGSNLPASKKNAYVNNVCIPDSGVADFLLNNIDLETLSSAEEVFTTMIPIKDYIATYNPQLYFACKALNYRTFAKKYDGDRPLAVFVNWTVKDNKLTPELIFDKPLSTKGNSVFTTLNTALTTLNINDTNDIDLTNVSSMNFVHN